MGKEDTTTSLTMEKETTKDGTTTNAMATKGNRLTLILRPTASSRAVVVEQALTGKHSQADCEDGIVVADNYIAVIDGSTSKTPKHYHPSMRNGRYAMTLISDYLRRAPASLSVNEFCTRVTQVIHQAYPLDDSQPRCSPEQRLCASAVVCNLQHKEIWMIGDCQCMVDGQLYTNDKPSEATIAEERSRLFPTLLAEHPDMVKDGRIVHDYARDAVLPKLIVSMRGENRTYAVIDGFEIFMPGVKVITLRRGEPHDIVLASDGYPFLRPTLQDSEAALKEQLANDPYNIHTFKATKGLMQGNVSFDDRALIRFRLTK